LDENLLNDAKEASGAKTDSETVRLALEALLRQDASQRLRAFGRFGTRRVGIPRRREREAKRKLA
jgi:hypothetical protein